jgi:hypothetical protein
MATVAQIIDVKFLSLCPPGEAVAWLKEKRAGVTKLNSLFRSDFSFQEQALALRNDPYIDFGLARYGMNTDAAKEVYARGDTAIRLTFLAYFPNGGFATIFERFELADEPPTSVGELSALAINPSLSDTIFEQCFEKKGVFEGLSEDDYQTILVAIADNKRLMTPYDDSFLDGFSDYMYHKVFSAAWELTAVVPNTPKWANVMYHLLYRCLPPVGFDPKPVLSRWMFARDADKDPKDAGFYLRSRLADLLDADDDLLKSPDGALRESFYKRFRPSKYPKWATFVKDTNIFLEAALWNEHLWRTNELRGILSRLCWDHPDPHSSMDMPNMFRGHEPRMREKHPEWFADET